MLSGNPSGAEPPWKTVSSGVEYRASWVNQKSAQEMHVLRWNPRKAELRHLKAPRKQNARDFLDQSQALAVFNGGYFDDKGRPLGLLFANTWVHRQAASGSAFGGMFSLIGNTPKLWPIYQISDSQYDQVREATDLRFLIQCGPRLLSDGQTVSGLERNTFTRRTAIGYDDQGRLYLMATALHYTMSFSQLQNYLKDQLKLRSALNLDGGSSTQCSIRDQVDCFGFSPIPFALGVFGKK